MWELLTWELPWRDTTNPWQVRVQACACSACVCAAQGSLALHKQAWEARDAWQLTMPREALTACSRQLGPACPPAAPAAGVLQVAKHVLDGGRLPIPGPGQLPGPGGDFQAPGLAGGMALYLSLMGRCWAQRPEDRPTFSDIINSLRCASWLLGVALASHSDSCNCSCQQQKCFNSQPSRWQL